MSNLDHYRELDKNLEDIQKKMDDLQNNPAYQAELRFEADLRALMKKHDKTATDIVETLGLEGLLKQIRSRS